MESACGIQINNCINFTSGTACQHSGAPHRSKWNGCTAYAEQLSRFTVTCSFVFPDSNERYLTEEEVYALNDAEEYDFQTLLGHARNEIYARHGYAFNENGIYYPFYMEYDWYRNMEHHVVSDSELNEYEQANRDLIVAIERKEGYRK